MAAQPKALFFSRQSFLGNSDDTGIRNRLLDFLEVQHKGTAISIGIQTIEDTFCFGE